MINCFVCKQWWIILYTLNVHIYVHGYIYRMVYILYCTNVLNQFIAVDVYMRTPLKRNVIDVPGWLLCKQSDTDLCTCPPMCTYMHQVVLLRYVLLCKHSIQCILTCPIFALNKFEFGFLTDKRNAMSLKVSFVREEGAGRSCCIY